MDFTFIERVIPLPDSRISTSTVLAPFHSSHSSSNAAIASSFTADERAAMNRGLGLHAELLPGPEHIPVRNRTNDYLVDREEQKTLTFTGIKGTGEQDFSVQETMGPIVDRSREHLGSVDKAIIVARKLLDEAVRSVADGGDAPGLSRDLCAVRAYDTIISIEDDWRGALLPPGMRGLPVA